MPASRKPLIGVTPLWDDKLESLWMLPGYFDGITEAGGIPVMLPLTDDEASIEQLVGSLDGVLVAGGHDMGPDLYGEEPGPKTVELCPARDRMEMRLIPAALRHDKPLLGICRGIQSLNVALGGTLWQDLPSQHPGDVEHHGKPPYDEPVHTVRVEPNSPLAAALWPDGDGDERFDRFHPAADTLAVNSFHHQAIRLLGDGLKPMAIAPDGIVEAVYAPDRRFVWAVQWHPEFAHKVDANQRAIFSAFVEAAANQTR
ncbi:gamma-glutamyl-gamma-aminobutyrate hydrolase family protein [Bifidobacterium leontopitheci]|uniref:Glutamine amidotransferase n=1 Tax=Bifidobacterium leontopitheci TaxID=2650774 RepID=A0A6I1GIF9_9BIFI|nr:gamma-glutamyl-gamma-aminobutyrate hydrolase family protein [Bifidobacterium leontopitheci]KAB7790492.1 glutamine amidotransferase [Bifidobacterium leontopitheci]